MKQQYKILIIVGAVVLLLVAFFAGSYNKMVTREETTTQAWANVETAYQRRMDLIPNLMNTVKGAANFEKSTLESVVAARSKASSVTVDPSKLDENSIAKFQQAQDQLGSSLNRLMVVVERYPELKSNENFLELQAQLEGTENRISVERMKFNKTIQDYNTYIRRFPNNIVAGMFGFDKKGYFKASEGAENAPKVEFDFGN